LFSEESGGGSVCEIAWVGRATQAGACVGNVAMGAAVDCDAAECASEFAGDVTGRKFHGLMVA